MELVWNAYDAAFYRERIEEYLPDTVIDAHAHIWLDSFRVPECDGIARGAAWPARVASENSIEDLLATYRALFPGKSVMPLLFGFPDGKYDIAKQNEYVRDMAGKHRFPALALTMPRWSAHEFEAVIGGGGFCGCKAYFNYAPDYIPEKEIRIFDFLPAHQLEVLNRHGWIAMLHIPREGRLRDPVNLAQMLEIERDFPRVRLIVAHAGRAYCPEDANGAWEALSRTENMLFDISANCCEQVFTRLIGAVGSGRILFGSDLPILRMRARRICENGKYVNIVPAGLYGDLSTDAHMREAGGKDAEKITFLMYEGLYSFLRACRSAGLRGSDIERIFYRNAAQMLGME